MHPLPNGYSAVDDGDTIQEGDLALGKMQSVCGQETYGWRKVASFLVGQEFFKDAYELGHPSMLVRKNTSSDN